MTATILLTRPQPQSEALAQTLRPLGWRALIAPMLLFAGLPPPSDFRRRVQTAGALAFTSANGVRAFAAASTERGPRVYAVGDATADAARAAGFAHVASADGDTDALYDLIANAPPDGAVLHIRGAHGRGDLSGRLRAAGTESAALILYDMTPAESLPGDADAALRAGSVDAAAFFSPRTARIFADLARQAGLAPLPGLRAVAISDAAAAPLTPLGLARIDIANRPSTRAMLTAIGAPDSAAG